MQEEGSINTNDKVYNKGITQVRVNKPQIIQAPAISLAPPPAKTPPKAKTTLPTPKQPPPPPLPNALPNSAIGITKVVKPLFDNRPKS